jgi:serine/threonine-protein kinase HipA
MEQEVLVYVDLHGTPQLAGRLWMRLRRDRESATFEYDKSWLAHSERFWLDPALKLAPSTPHPTGRFSARSATPLRTAGGAR